MIGFLDVYVPAPDQLLAAAAALIVALGLIGLGGLVGGRRRLAEADMACGWAVVCLVFTVVGVFTELPFTAIAALLGAAAAGALVLVRRRDGRVLVAGSAKVLALGAALVLVVAGLTPSQWDEYSHWLLAERYLFEVDTFPRRGYPESDADFPGYPYAVPLAAYLVSRLSGAFVENAGALVNVALLLAFALLYVRLVRKGLGAPQEGTPGWGLAALGILGVTVLNTAFVQKVIFTAYADFASAVALAFAAVSGWLALEALAAGEHDRARRYAVQMGLVLAALVNAKQANLVHFVFVVAGVLLAGWRDPAVRVAAVVRLLPAMLGPALLIYAVWQIHVQGDLSTGAQSVMPMERWEIGLLPQVLSTILGIMARKGAYFGLMALLVVLAVRGLFAFRGGFDRLAIIVATVFVGYNLFLVFAYVAVFGGYTGANALSYWRYNQQLGLLGVVCTAYGGALLWRRHLAALPARAVGRVLVALVVVLPIAFAPKLRFDLRAPKLYVKRVGAEIAALLPDGARLFVVDPLDTGFYAKIMRYQIRDVGGLVGQMLIHAEPSADYLRRRLDAVDASHVWVHTQLPALATVFAAPLAERASHLLVRRDGAWSLIRSWPYPGYARPQDVPD